MRKVLKMFSFLILLVSCLSVTRFITAYDESYITAQIPANYYDDVNLNVSSTVLKETLSTIISENFVRFSYGTKTNEILLKSDPDPANSNNIICLYTGQSLSSGAWNKEHVWAKSHGFPKETSNAYCDAHHLRPTLISINSKRGNLDFDEVENQSGTVEEDGFGNRWIEQKCFEPRDEVKGDVARMMFYMETKYYGGSESLRIVENIPTSASDSNGRLGSLSTLIKWHYEDPVSDEEVYRNNVVYGYQKNRNPYIDHPEYVDYAYPNEFANPVDQEKVDAVINQINAISEVTSNTKNQILAASEAYNALTTEEKKLVTNYQKLANYLAQLEDLDKVLIQFFDGNQKLDNLTVNTIKGTTITKPADPSKEGYRFDGWYDSTLTNKFDFITIINDNINLYAKWVPLTVEELFGQQNTKTSLNAAYRIDSSAITYEVKGTANNGTALENSVNNAAFLNLSENIFFVEGSRGDSNLFPKVYGTQLRIYANSSLSFRLQDTSKLITSIVINTASNYVPPTVLVNGTEVQSVDNTYMINANSFTLKNTGQQTRLESINIQMGGDAVEVQKASIRFGTSMPSELFDPSANYGVLLVKKTILSAEGSATIAELFDKLASMNSLNEVISGSLNLGVSIHQVACTPVRVDSNGVANPNGDYYQFAAVINNIPIMEEVVAVCYMENESGVYFMNEASHSIRSAAQYYIDNLLSDFTEKEILVLKKLSE